MLFSFSGGRDGCLSKNRSRKAWQGEAAKEKKMYGIFFPRAVHLPAYLALLLSTTCSISGMLTLKECLLVIRLFLQAPEGAILLLI
jgi:hypothetical protein